MKNYIASLLADIAYLDFYSDDFTDGKLSLSGASKRGLTVSEMNFFNENFNIIRQSVDLPIPFSTGFSGMVIAAKQEIYFNGSLLMSAHEQSLVFRGTESLGDFTGDIELAANAALNLRNKIKEFVLNISNGFEVDLTGFLNNFQPSEVVTFFNTFEGQKQAALQFFNESMLFTNNNKVNLYGHSLGGFLANYTTVMGDNNIKVNETITFNAPGFNAGELILNDLITSLKTLQETTIDINDKDKIQQKINQLLQYAKEDIVNPTGLDLLNSIYSTTGPELTAADDLGLFHPELRIPLYTDDAGDIANHFVRYLRESLCVYDSLNCLMSSGNTLTNYEYITGILTGFKKDFLINSNFKAIDETLKHISVFLGIPSSNGIDVLNFIDSLSGLELLSYNVNKMTEKNISDALSSDGRSILYSLINYIPFTITGSTNINEQLYNPQMYTKELIESRFDMFDKLMKTADGHIYRLNNSEIEKLKFYKVFYDDKGGSDFAYIDAYNEFIYTNNLDIFKELDNYLNTNAKMTYFSDGSTLIIDTLKNIIYDYFEDDYIALNKGETVLDLSYGSDTIMIDVAAGATIKDVFIKDDGIGDLFIFNGGSNSDIITGTKYKDKIIGNDGDDHLFSGAGNDTINGGNGNDFIFGEDGDDNLIGDDGDDRIMGGAGSNYLEGGNGDDTLNAYNTLNEYHDIRGDRLSGGSGTNTLFGTGYGDTYIYGGGIDTIRESDKNFGINYVDKLLFSSNIQSSQVGLYNILNNLVIFINGLEKIFVIDYYNNNYSYLDEIHFINPITGYPIIWDTNYILQHTINTADNKVIIGSNNAETINGTEADNYIEGRDGNDIINGGDGNDTIYGGNGNDTIHGNNGDDILYGDAGADNIYGDAGNDVIYGGEGNDFLIGGAGNDLIFGEDGDDNISGDDGNDTIHGGIGNDTLNGGNGNDTIYGGVGVDTIQGGAGADTIYGDDGNDIINGGNVRDEVDTIYGGNGNDIINQGSTYTNDIIIGGKGDDTIYGNVGSDKYHYTIGDGNDTIIEANDGASYIDSLYLHGISPNDVEIIRKGANVTDIYITFKDSSEFITIKGYYKSSSGTNYLDEIIFDNGTVWKKANIIEEAKRYYGTEGNDSIAVQSNGLPQAIYTGGGNDSINNSVQGTFINSGDGGDTITSSNNDVIIDADAGDDTIRVVSGTNITINGGAGSDNIQLTTGKETIIYNVNDGSDTITTTGAGGDIFNISGYNKIDLSNIFLSGQGKTLELRFNAGDSIKLTNYINLLANINNAMTFNFDNGSMSNIELKDLYTIINKAEIADNKFYDTVASDQITGTDGNDNINIINGNGGAGFDVVNSGNGIDTITNKIDNTVINAGNDNDIIYTYGQNVTINGDAGDDRIYINETSYVGSGYLNGGEGNDTISFQTYTPVSNNYIIEGDLGNDTINMSRGTETIIFKKNDGNDTINISGSNEPSQKDKLIIKGYSKNDITADNFLLFDNGRSVTLKLGLNDSIKLVNFLSGTLASNNLKYFEFDDGTLTSQELIEKITYIKGTNGNDIIYDTVFNDTIDLSGLGDDRVTLKNGNDLLITGNQSTFIEIQSSNNTINSGSGSDYLYINVNSTNTLNLKSSNNGHDSIGFAYLNTNGIIHVNINKTINIADTSVKGNYYKFSWGHDSSLSFTPDALNNRIIFNNQIMNLDDVNLVGDDGDNYLKAISSKGQTIYGNGGVDTIYGSINNDIIHGGLGNDKIYGEGGNDTLYGDDGDDLIAGLNGNNTIYGGEGNDTIYIGKGNDVVYGGNGNDYIESVSGLNGVDFIYGGDGDDTIKGGAYYGEFHGQDGNDTYEIYKGLIVDQSGSNALIFRESNYTASAIRQTSNGFQLFKGDEILVDYIGIVNKIQINSPSPDGYGRYASLVGNEINKLFELQAALTHEIENDNSAQKINELRSQMSYLWRTDTQ